MTSQSNLEITGDLRQHQLAELLIEIFQAKLNGSLRLSNAAQKKTVIYFDAGDIVFAVSNARQFRLFELLLRENKITKEQLAAIPDFTNDLALRDYFLKSGALPKPEVERLFPLQIAEILKETFNWREGEWIFSPLVRIKGDIRFQIDPFRLLVECARNLPDEDLPRNFRSLQEIFAVKSPMPARINLLPEEAFVLSRFENHALEVEKVVILSGLPPAATFRILYILWLGGFLTRQNWNSPFSDRRVSAILSANLTLKKTDAPVAAATESLPEFSGASNNDGEKLQIEPPKPPIREETTISLEEYLELTENAPNLYQLFNIAPDADAARVKQAYFTFAKRFHPDLFHKEVDAGKHRQIQNAFTKLAQAYETLKHEKSRSVYDYQMRKELAEDARQQSATTAAAGTIEEKNLRKQAARASEDFEQGFSLLINQNYAEALAFLARAAHLAPDNARYRAYYGKALSADAKQKHKAESELQTAVRLDANNADLRLLLVEFFVQMNLLKRAEGELNRLLAIFPDNREARALLDSLAKR